MEGVIQVVLVLALHWQLQVVNAQDANTQCEKSFSTNYGQVSNQDFANVTCNQLKIRVNGKEPLLLLCPYFMLKVEDQEYCMTVSWTDRDRNITAPVPQNTNKKKKNKNKNNKNKSQKKKKNRKKSKKNADRDKNIGSRKKKGRKNRNKATKKGQRRKRNAKRNVKASKNKHKKRPKPWEEKIRLPRALTKTQKRIGTRQRANKTRKRPATKTVPPKTRKFKKGTKDYTARFEFKSFVTSYCGMDKPYGLNAYDGIVNIDIAPSPNTNNINRQQVIDSNERSGGGESINNNNIVTASLGTQGTVQQQIPEAGQGIHPDIVFQCFWSPSAP